MCVFSMEKPASSLSYTTTWLAARELMFILKVKRSTTIFLTVYIDFIFYTQFYILRIKFLTGSNKS